MKISFTLNMEHEYQKYPTTQTQEAILELSTTMIKHFKKFGAEVNVNIDFLKEKEEV